MLGIWAGALPDWNGRPTPWNSRADKSVSAELVEHIVGRKFIDVDDEPVTQRADLSAADGRPLGDHMQLVERGLLDRPPSHWFGKRVGHAIFLCEAKRLAKRLTK